MGNSVNLFYECDNPDCKLRFPGSVEQPRCNRCPACRSSLHVVASGISSNEKNYEGSNHGLCQVEAVLDNVRSAWNVGSIFRTADGTGVRKLYLCGITPSPQNAKVGKTALGAEAIVPWEKSHNGLLLAKRLKSDGYLLWALEDLPGAQPLFMTEIDTKEAPIALVVGNEVSGIDPGIIEQCDVVISIPMVGNKQSYNVAVAFGIAASFLLYRQSVSHGSFNILPRT